MASSTSNSPNPSSYWCHRCSRFTTVLNPGAISCPGCNSGFIEEIEVNSSIQRPMVPIQQPISIPSYRRTRRNGSGDRSPFNPVIVLRGPLDASGERTGFELFYDDGVGSGLCPLPESMSEFLLGSGFDRLLDQLSQLEFGGLSQHENPPASKSSVECMPSIDISRTHVECESHCAICKERFEIGSEAREMPCKHIYHPECILPWLAIRNSCPMCRHELPLDRESNPPIVRSNSWDLSGGLTIWRLPGGGYAVGRFSGGIRGGPRDFPMVYTEMDGGEFNGSGSRRQVRLETHGASSPRGSGSLMRSFRILFSCFRSSNMNGSRQRRA